MAGSWHCFNHITQFIWDCELTHSSDWFMGQMGKRAELAWFKCVNPAKKACLMRLGGRWTSPWFYPIRMYIQRSIIVYWMVVWMIVYFCIFFRGWLNHQPVYHHVTICFHPLLPTRNEVSSATGSFRHSALGSPGSLPNRCSVMDEVRCKGSHDHYEWKSGKCKEKWSLPFNMAVS